MEKLFFTLQHDRQFKRQIHMLKYLSTIQAPISTMELAEELSCTKPTLLTDIRSLNLQLPSEIRITKQSRDGIELIYPDGRSIDSYITDLAKQTLVFQIIDNIFHNRILSFHQALDELYVSKSVLRKVIGHMNEILKSFNISVSTINIDLIGEESDIRFFLFVFYCDFRDYFVVRSNDDRNAESYVNLLIAARTVNLPRLHFNYFRATIWIMIYKNRLIHKHFVTLNEDMKKTILAKKSFQDFDKIFHEAFNKSFGLKKLSIDESIWCYIVCLHCISYTAACSYDDPQEEFVFHREESEVYLEQINQLIKSMFSSELIADKHVEIIRGYLVNMRQLCLLTPRFARISLPLKEFVKESNPKLLKEWSSVLEEQAAEFYPQDYLVDIASTLTLLHTSMLSNHESTRIKIIFSFQGEAGYDDFLVTASKLLLKDNVDTEYFFERSVTKDVIQKKNAKLVVCNYDLPTIKDSPCNIIRLSYIPSAAEWTMLRSIVHTLQFG